MTYSRTEVDASPDLRLAWQRGRLDARCLSCGATMAATSRCYRCHGTLEYREHVGTRSQWCNQGAIRRMPHKALRMA